MFKNLFLTAFLLLTLIGIIVPAKEENIKLFDYCYSLEKIMSRNTLQTNNKLSKNAKSITQAIKDFGVSRTRGSLINKIIDQYKTSKNLLIINLLPNNFYCWAGYWIEKVKPGTFELIFYEKSKKSINEFKNFRDEIDLLLNDINSDYKNIKEELKNLF